jgi:hypothetical protein
MRVMTAEFTKVLSKQALKQVLKQMTSYGTINEGKTNNQIKHVKCST